MNPSPEPGDAPVAPPVAPPPPAGVGRTALGVARIRAAESARPDRLFDDPFAAAFVAAAADPATRPEELDERARRLVRWVAFFAIIRTRFYDDYLSGATRAGCRQVVLVAAGLDTRAYRLDWPDDMRLFELDSPEVLAFKEAVLGGLSAAPRCERAAIGTDLLGDWWEALLASGFRPEEPTAWLVEGLLIYLDAADAGALLARISELSAPGSRLSCEVQAPRDGDRDGDRPLVPGYTDLWKGGLGAELPDRLRSLGWATDVNDRAAVAALYGRPGPSSGGAGFAVAMRGRA